MLPLVSYKAYWSEFGEEAVRPPVAVKPKAAFLDMPKYGTLPFSGHELKSLNGAPQVFGVTCGPLQGFDWDPRLTVLRLYLG